MPDIWEGIIIGAAGGASAGLIILSVNCLVEIIKTRHGKQKALKWLEANTEPNACYTFRSTRTIASHCNLTQDRVRFICSDHKNIQLSTGNEDDVWKLREN